MCILTFFSFLVIVSGKNVVDISPKDYNVTIGMQKVTYICKKLMSSYDNLYFGIDNSSVIDENLKYGNKIIERHINDSHSILILPIILRYNNSAISCYNYYSDYSISYGRLRIQGRLSPPPELSISLSTNFTGYLVIFWKAPFTLDLTDVDPDIIGYKVCIGFMFTDMDTIEHYWDCFSVEIAMFKYLQVCVPLNISVTAVNIDGDGYPHSILLPACTSKARIKVYT